MTDKAVSALTSLTGSGTATGDLLYIVDISEASAADRSKKITAQELQNYIKGFPATIGVGGATPAASGAGVSFPATQSASSNANTLDDYEQGSFNPTIATASANVTYSQQAGNYTKIGRAVHFGMSIVLNTVTSTGSGDFEIGGLPFPSSSTDVNQVRFVIQTQGVDFDATAYNMYAYIPTTSSSVLKVLYSFDNANWSVATSSTFVIAAGDVIVVTGTYFADD